MALVESTLSSVLRKHQQNPYNQKSRPVYHFYIQLPNDQTIYKVTLQLQPLILLSQALLLAIDEFNLQFEAFNLKLLKKIDYYVPRLTKKNGKAKTDMPCLDISQRLIDIKIISIGIQIKDIQNAIELIGKMDENLQQLKSKKSDTKSTIMVQMKSTKSSKKYSEQIYDLGELVKDEKRSQCFCSFC